MSLKTQDNTSTMDTYSKHAEICAKFYELAIDAESTSTFVFEKSRAAPEKEAGEKALFIGGMFQVAKGLIDKGLNLTVVDYTDQMVNIGKAKLLGTQVEKADLRSLPYLQQFDIIFAIGRVFTHMTTDEDLHKALSACRKSLKKGGRLFFDNYEDTKIQKTKYFNGTIRCHQGTTTIQRTSSTTKISDSPYLVRWDAEYSGHINNNDFSFSDSSPHRAFSRQEIADLLPRFNFKLIAQGDNFDETSFYTLAEVVGG